MSKQATILVIVAIGWAGLLGACSSENVVERPISLTTSETSKAMAAKEIGSFLVMLTHTDQADAVVNISLDTTQGASWKAALCFDDFCYMHNGKDKMRQTLAVTAGETRQLEIKMFVPKTAASGEAKTLKVEALVGQDLAASSSLELKGFVP